MSRVGQVPIQLPSGVTVDIDSKEATVKGPKGELVVKTLKGVDIKQEGDAILVTTSKTTATARARHGLVRTLLANAVHGASEGFEQKLEVRGVGYKAQVSGRLVTLNLGYSAPIEYQLPEGAQASVEENTITISGIDKQLVGQVAAHIRSLRKPEPYKGKGIRYEGEQVKRKAGKTAAAGPTGAGE